jgi:hypothetical protein
MLLALFGSGLALLVWLAVASRLPALVRSPAQPALRAYWLSLLTLALALTVRLPVLYLLIDTRAGIPNFARLLGDVLVVTSAWTVQMFLYHLYFPDTRAAQAIRRGSVVFAGTLLLLGALFAVAPVDEEALDFAGRYAQAPFILEYRLVVLAYVGFSLINLARPAWRYARLAADAVVRLSLRLVALGAWLGLACVVLEGLRALSGRLGFGSALVHADSFVELSTAVAIGSIVVGSTMPAWGGRVGVAALTRWLERYRACRRLYPLWRALCRAHPDSALEPPPTALRDALVVRDLGFRLYRRVVEIHDGYLALRPYLDRRATQYARALCEDAELTAPEAAAVIDAAGLATALAAKAAGRTAAEPAATSLAPTGTNLSSEIRYLERVAHSYASSPLVQAVVAHIQRAGSLPKQRGAPR